MNPYLPTPVSPDLLMILSLLTDPRNILRKKIKTHEEGSITNTDEDECGKILARDNNNHTAMEHLLQASNLRLYLDTL